MEKGRQQGPSMINPDRAESDSAEVHFQLAKAWQLKGDIDSAIARYRQALRCKPDYLPALLQLGLLMLTTGHTKEALEYYNKALTLNPDDPEVRFRRNTIKGLIEKKAVTHIQPVESTQDNKIFAYKENPEGKIDISNQKTFSCHRSGWNFALHALMPLHNSKGIMFDGFIEKNFAWNHWKEGISPPDVLNRMKIDGTFDELATSEERGITPYKRPWVGFVHNPQGMPTWFHYQESPQSIFAKDIWQQSIEYCLGLFTFSEYHAEWLREQTGKPVSTLIHPTESPELRFDFERFLANPYKKIAQVGWWLRKLNAIYQLPIASNNPLKYEKIRLIPMFFDNADEYLKKLMQKEVELNQLTMDPAFSQNTKDVHHLSNNDYDRLLSENIAFVDLYDSNANNLVIECIARATPLLINPLPAVIEYLGHEYPMYFNSLDEALEKSLDVSLIFDTHIYLQHCETAKKLSADYFFNSFKESKGYKAI
jgi:tetratricopeptide (TPR) repeat protein